MATRLPSGMWRARWYNERGERVSRTFTSKKAATAAEEKARTQLRDGSYEDPLDRKVTFDQWTTQYVAHANLRPSTLASIEQNYRNHIKPRWGTTPLVSIRQLDVMEWIADLKKPGSKMNGETLAPLTAKLVYSVFARIYRASVDAGVLPNSNLPRKPGLGGEKKKPIRFLTISEVNRLATAIDPRFETLIWCGCLLGFRISELVALRLDDINWEQGTIRVDEAQVRLKGVVTYDAPKTSRSQRIIYVPEGLMVRLHDHVEKYSASSSRAFVFTKPDGSPLRASTWGQTIFKPAAERAGLSPLTPHDMRHTAASLAISSGVNTLLLAEILGHTGTRMIEQVYGHLYDEQRKQAALALNNKMMTGLASNVVPFRRPG